MIIRDAENRDAADMSALLNAIIAKGGTTAHQRPFDPERMRKHYLAQHNFISCIVAEDAGRIIGFQSLAWPGEDEGRLPKNWGIIASFVADQAAGKGVGQRLFAATRQKAQAANVATIDATIRADNVPGLRYYSGLGFVDYDRIKDVPLSDGTLVDRVCKRFDLP